MRANPCNSIPTSVSTSEQWINWHEALLGWFSKQEANSYFLRFWSQRAGAGTPADTVSLREYMREQGVDLTTDFSGEIADTIEGISNWFADLFTGIRNIFLGAVIIAIALIAFYMIRNIQRGQQIKGIRGEASYGGSNGNIQPISPLNQKLLS